MTTKITAAVARERKALFSIERLRFPVEKLTRQYGLEDINQAFDDSASSDVIKPVIVF